MIARYDGRSGRWSATGLAVSLLVAGVAFTGAVNVASLTTDLGGTTAEVAGQLDRIESAYLAGS